MTPPESASRTAEFDIPPSSTQSPRRIPSLGPRSSIFLRTPAAPQTPSFLGSFLPLQSTNLSNVSLPARPPFLSSSFPTPLPLSTLLPRPLLAPDSERRRGLAVLERRGEGVRQAVPRPPARSGPAPGPRTRPRFSSATAAPGRTAPSRESRRLTVATATPTAPRPRPRSGPAPLPPPPPALISSPERARQETQALAAPSALRLRRALLARDGPPRRRRSQRLQAAAAAAALALKPGPARAGSSRGLPACLRRPAVERSRCCRPRPPASGCCCFCVLRTSADCGGECCVGLSRRCS